MSTNARVTGVDDASIQFPQGRWPDQISFNKRLSTYLFSAASNVNITALDHIHVINYDLDGTSPYTMTLNLPVMHNLPASSRMYFFYVSRCHYQDVLTFTTVPLSGDTINGQLGSFSFTLLGAKTLFVAVGVSGNYIIHPINASLSPSTGSNIPMIHFDLDNSVTPSYTSDPIDPNPDSSYAIPGNDAFIDYSIAIPGMDGFITPNVAIPSQLFQGFLCEKSGIYGINPIVTFNQSFTATSTIGVHWALIAEWSPTGALITFVHAPAFVTGNFPPSGTPIQYNIIGSLNTTFYYELVEGNYYTIGFIWNINGGTIISGEMDGGVTFQYWCPLPPTPSPGPDSSFSSLFAAPSSSRSVVASSVSSPSEITMGSKQDKPTLRKAEHKKLVDAGRARSQSAAMAAAAQAAGAAGVGSSGFSSGISLADVERIVQQVLRSSQAAGAAAQPAPPAAPVVISSSSSSSVSAGKKRARPSGSGGEVEPPSKK